MHLTEMSRTKQSQELARQYPEKEELIQKFENEYYQNNKNK